MPNISFNKCVSLLFFKIFLGILQKNITYKESDFYKSYVFLFLVTTKVMYQKYANNSIIIAFRSTYLYGFFVVERISIEVKKQHIYKKTQKIIIKGKKKISSLYGLFLKGFYRRFVFFSKDSIEVNKLILHNQHLSQFIFSKHKPFIGQLDKKIILKFKIYNSMA